MDTKSNQRNHFFEGKEVLVTGGAGFVGTNLILKLLEKGVKVRATIHQMPPQIKNSKVEFIKADLTRPLDCKRVVEGVDLVFMCAANTSGAAVIEKAPLAHVTPNVIMNSLMLEAAHKAGVKKFLFISSNTVYPLTDYAVCENDVNYTLYEKYFPVGWMKLFTEKMCEMYSTKIKSSMTTIIVRPGNIYGPYDDFEWESSHVIPALIRKVVERQNPLEVWGTGRDIKDFIYVEDLVEGLILAMEKINNFDQINIGGGGPITIRQVLNAIIEVDNFESPKIVFNSSKPTMIPIRLINIKKAKKILGFTPRTSLKMGIKKTVDWFKTLDEQMSNFSEISVAILAGGFGTRLQSTLKGKPKVLAEVRKHPFLEYLLHQLDKANFKNIVLCTGYLSDQVEKTFGRNYKNLHLLYSPEQTLLGTAGSLRKALLLLNSEIILVMNGDSFCEVDFKKFWQFHLSKNSNASLVLSSVSKTSRFGIVKLGNDDSILGFQEKKEGREAELINAGIYLINKSLLAEIPENKEISIEKDVFPNWIGKGFYGYKGNNNFIDIGTPESYAQVEQFFTKYKL